MKLKGLVQDENLFAVQFILPRSFAWPDLGNNVRIRLVQIMTNLKRCFIPEDWQIYKRYLSTEANVYKHFLFSVTCS